MFVGDSITVGKVGSTLQNGFRGPFKTLLSTIEHVGPFVDPTKLRHGGVGGATTRTFGITGDGSPQTADFVLSASSVKTWVQIYKPDIIVLMLGVNDIIANPKGDVSNIFSALATLLHLASIESPTSRLYVSSIVESGPTYYTDLATELNADLRKSSGVGAFKGTKFIDGCASLNAKFRRDGIKSVTIDDTHPNDVGYSLIANDLARGIQPRASSDTSMSGGARTALAVFGGFAAYKALRALFG